MDAPAAPTLFYSPSLKNPRAGLPGELKTGFESKVRRWAARIAALAGLSGPD